VLGWRSMSAASLSHEPQVILRFLDFLFLILNIENVTYVQGHPRSLPRLSPLSSDALSGWSSRRLKAARRALRDFCGEARVPFTYKCWGLPHGLAQCTGALRDMLKWKWRRWAISGTRLLSTRLTFDHPLYAGTRRSIHVSVQGTFTLRLAISRTIWDQRYVLRPCSAGPTLLQLTL